MSRLRNLLIGAGAVAAVIMIYLMVARWEHRELSPRLYLVFALLASIFIGAFVYYLLRQMRK